VWKGGFLKLLSASDILTKVYQKEAKPRFLGERNARVSLVGMCIRRHVAQILYPDQFDFDPYYSRAGYTLQERALAMIKTIYPKAFQEAIVPTLSDDYEKIQCHPDIYVPELHLGIQVKSCSDGAAKEKRKTKSHYEQALLEWHFWKKAGYCVNRVWDGNVYTDYMEQTVPIHYELLYLARESYMLYYHSVPVKYVTTEAHQLELRLRQVQDYIDMEVLPEIPTKRQKDCFTCSQQCFPYSKEGDNDND
jgi:hypothetical protein